MKNLAASLQYAAFSFGRILRDEPMKPNDPGYATWNVAGRFDAVAENPPTKKDKLLEQLLEQLTEIERLASLLRAKLNEGT